MYESFFQLQSRPFPAAAVVGNYFPSHSVEIARQNLIRAVERAEGPGIVIGPAGVGKTLLLRVLASHFASTLHPVLISGTRVTTRKSLLQSILFELELPYRGMDEGELRLALIDAVRHQEKFQRGVLLLIDEAHTLPLRLLDEARLITNITQDGHPRVRLVLAGGPVLEERFTNPKLDSFNQRIAARCYLQPFTRDEVQEYIRAEISWAGGDPSRIFAEGAARAVFQATDGIPRLINQVCDHALIMAHAAEAATVDSARIQEAWSDLQQLPPPWQANGTLSTPATSAVVEFGQLTEETAASEILEPAAPVATPSAVAPTVIPPAAMVGSSPVAKAAAPLPAPSSSNTALTPVAGPPAVVSPVPTSQPVPTAATPQGRNDAPVATAESSVAGPSVPEQDTSPELLDDHEWLNFRTEVLVVQPQYVTDHPEWHYCEQPVAALAVDSEPASLQPPAEDPFVDSFEEELVVIDRTTARVLDGFRGRPRVSCPEGREFAAALSAHYEQVEPEPIAAVAGPGVPAAATIVTDSRSTPAFEFSTMQDLPEIDGSSELDDESVIVEVAPGAVHEQVELDFEEDADCVPLPWTRGLLGDDRDIIVVEDDVMQTPAGSSGSEPAGESRRTEYRELFAQLRRVST